MTFFENDILLYLLGLSPTFLSTIGMYRERRGEGILVLYAQGHWCRRVLPAAAGAAAAGLA